MQRVKRTVREGRKPLPTSRRARKPRQGGGIYFTPPKRKLEFIRTGCKPFDLALGGGWVRGRIANIVGDKSTGKTLLCIEAAANFIRQYPDGIVFYREAEAAFDEEYAATLGMPIANIDFGADQLETVEDFFEDLERCIRIARNRPALYILDSLDALSDRAEMKRTMDEGTYGAGKAKAMSQLFRRCVRQLKRTEMGLIIVSQVRDKIGVTFGRKTSRTGGRALDFYASHVVYLAQVGRVMRTVSGLRRPIGIKVLAKIDKNKIDTPFHEVKFQIRFGYGIDDGRACLDYLHSTRSLKLYGIGPKEIAGTAKHLMYNRKEMPELRKIVARRWREIEEGFKPTVGKYS